MTSCEAEVVRCGRAVYRGNRDLVALQVLTGVPPDHRVRPLEQGVRIPGRLQPWEGLLRRLRPMTPILMSSCKQNRSRFSSRPLEGRGARFFCTFCRSFLKGVLFSTVFARPLDFPVYERGNALDSATSNHNHAQTSVYRYEHADIEIYYGNT